MRLSILLSCLISVCASADEIPAIQFVTVEPGTFRMGNDQPVGVDAGGPPGSPLGDWDERPVHSVTITRALSISATEITAEQYRAYDANYAPDPRHAPWATHVSWDDAVAFCRWLSAKQGRVYRLPTAAEWEWAARRGMSSNVAQWVHDWHGMYPSDPQTDPVGPESGWVREIRGGAFDEQRARYYTRAANRAGLPPDYRPPYAVGFRIVQGELPATRPLLAEPPFVTQVVKQKRVMVPPLSGAYYRRRWLLTIPPESASPEASESVGLHGGIHYHNHSPGLAVLPNGDLLATYFSSPKESREDATDATMIAARLRFGAEEWDLPDMLVDVPDANDQSALMWTEGGAVNFAWGGRDAPGVIFKWISSNDSGATWSPIRFVHAEPGFGGYAEQPVTSAFRDAAGVLYLATDGKGGTTVLWSSSDNGKTWRDTGGRTGGRHTAIVVRKDGCFLGMGGKNTGIEGYMPQSVSCDSGKTWKVEKSPFPALNSGQRPTLIRLASGRLFFASDHQSSKGKQPEGYTKHGSFVGLSDDDGATWKLRDLDAPTLGYTVARQAPDGVIHLITSKGEQALHFEMNEAWILGEAPAARTGESKRTSLKETVAGGGRGEWAGVVGADGRFRLDGPEMWFHANGKPRYEVNWRMGRKAGVETYWDSAGRKLWTWTHRAEGSTWTRYAPDGSVLSRSTWKDGRGSALK